jgi:Ca2+-binding EF-hand superfamily protein
VDIGEGLQVPNYFQIMFKIIDTGNKGYIYEQDLFTMMQDFDRKRDKHLKI